MSKRPFKPSATVSLQTEPSTAPTGQVLWTHCVWGLVWSRVVVLGGRSRVQQQQGARRPGTLLPAASNPCKLEV
jgi:hypothetical protein